MRLWGDLYFNNLLARNLSWVYQSKATGSPFLHCYHTDESNCQGSPLAERKQALERPCCGCPHSYLSTWHFFAHLWAACLGLAWPINKKKNQSQKQINSKSNKIREREMERGVWGHLGHQTQNSWAKRHLSLSSILYLQMLETET